MSGLRQFTPPSMKGLNFNIDADLDLGNTHSLKSSNVLLYGTGHISCLTNTDDVYVDGGTGIAGTGAAIILSGYDSIGTGRMRLTVPNATHTANIDVLMVNGITATPYLDMLSHRIAALAQATTDMDAAPVTKMWVAWTPTLVWTTATPAAVGKTARYCQIGKTVFFHLIIASADSNACTNLTISLPVAPRATPIYPPVQAYERINSVVGADPVGMIYDDGADNLIHFVNFRPGVDGQEITIFISGHYEAA